MYAAIPPAYLAAAQLCKYILTLQPLERLRGWPNCHTYLVDPLKKFCYIQNCLRTIKYLRDVYAG
jgi:hypothetical protein